MKGKYYFSGAALASRLSSLPPLFATDSATGCLHRAFLAVSQSRSSFLSGPEQAAYSAERPIDRELSRSLSSINTVRARDGPAVFGFDVAQLMSTPILSCRSSDRVDAMLARMTIARVRHRPVIEDNELKGIVSIGDLVKQRLDAKELEASVLLDLSRMRA